MQTATKPSTDETQIADVLRTFTAALRDKNARAAVACYARDVVAYDLAPPLRLDAREDRVGGTGKPCGK